MDDRFDRKYKSSNSSQFIEDTLVPSTSTRWFLSLRIRYTALRASIKVGRHMSSKPSMLGILSQPSGLGIAAISEHRKFEAALIIFSKSVAWRVAPEEDAPQVLPTL